MGQAYKPFFQKSQKMGLWEDYKVEQAIRRRIGVGGYGERAVN